MAIVAIGHIERMIWWNGTDTKARETFETAMLIVKVSGVKVSEPKPKRKKQPNDVEAV